MSVLPPGMPVHHMHATYPCRPSEGTDPLKLKLQSVMSGHEGAGN